MRVAEKRELLRAEAAEVNTTKLMRAAAHLIPMSWKTITVMFAFTSMEFIGMTAAETVNPKKSLPKAINQIPVRILLFYVGALLAQSTIKEDEEAKIEYKFQWPSIQRYRQKQ